MIWGSLCLCFFQESLWAQKNLWIQLFPIVKSPPFIAGFYYNWFAFLPGYFGRILTRSIFARWTSHKKMICPGISSLELARRTQERASPISTGTVHFAHGDCFDDRFCSRPMREVRISSKHWRQWWNVINDDQQRIMLRTLWMLFHAIVSSLVSGSTGESTPKSGWEKGLGTQVLTNGALHHSTFCLLWPGKAWERKTWPQHVGVDSKTSNTKPQKIKAASIALRWSSCTLENGHELSEISQCCRNPADELEAEFV